MTIARRACANARIYEMLGAPGCRTLRLGTWLNLRHLLHMRATEHQYNGCDKNNKEAHLPPPRQRLLCRRRVVSSRNSGSRSGYWPPSRRPAGLRAPQPRSPCAAGAGTGNRPWQCLLKSSLSTELYYRLVELVKLWVLRLGHGAYPSKTQSSAWRRCSGTIAQRRTRPAEPLLHVLHQAALDITPIVVHMAGHTRRTYLTSPRMAPLTQNHVR